MHVVAHVSHYVVFYTTLPYLFIHSSQLEFQNLDFLSHVVAYLVSFDSRFETRKSDIIRSRYELFNACGGSCPSLRYLFIDSSQLEFRNLDFFIPCRSLYRKL